MAQRNKLYQALAMKTIVVSINLLLSCDVCDLLTIRKIQNLASFTILKHALDA